MLRYELWKIRELKRIKRDKEDRLREVLDLWIVGSSKLGLFGLCVVLIFDFSNGCLFIYIYIHIHLVDLQGVLFGIIPQNLKQ